MIRFNCTNCAREYLLADAMAHLPLLCKSCGHRLEVPGPQPDPIVPEPKPSFERSLPQQPKPAVLTSDEKYNAREEHVSTAGDSEVDLFLSPDVRKNLRVAIEGSGPPAPAPQLLPSPESVARPEPERPAEKSRKTLAIAVDAAVAVLLLAIGMFAGEAVAGKPTVEILRGAGAAPTFPPTDLLLWLGSVAIFGLAYAWLGTRGWTVGGLLKRR